MAVAVTYVYTSKHIPAWNANGHVRSVPALPASPGLYVIRNKAQPAHVYAGTSVNVQDRFSDRLKVYRESGLAAAVLNNLRFYVIKVKIDDQARWVDDTGRLTAYGRSIDVENLLIRSIVVQAQINVFNVAKWQHFQNPFNQRLDVEFENFPHSTHYFVPDDFYVPSNSGF